MGHHCICVLADSYLLILFSFNLENLSNYLLLLNLLNFILDLYSNFWTSYISHEFTLLSFIAMFNIIWKNKC